MILRGGALLVVVLAGCGISEVEEPMAGEEGGETDPGTSCEGGEEPVACVGLDTQGCLSVPAGQAQCVDGQWACEQPFTAPQLDPDERCTQVPAGSCEGERPTCTNQSRNGECSDYVIDISAFCVDDAWDCPPGFHHDEVSCDWSETSGG